MEGVLELSTGPRTGRARSSSVAVLKLVAAVRRHHRPRRHRADQLAGVRLARRDFDAFAREHPALEHKLLERTLGELDRTRRWMLLLGRKSASEKLASFLLELSERLSPATCEVDFGEPGHTRIELPFSRQQIADVLGLTIETVSRQFTRLKSEGVIDLPSRREVVIIDHDARSRRTG